MRQASTGEGGYEAHVGDLDDLLRRSSRGIETTERVAAMVTEELQVI